MRQEPMSARIHHPDRDRRRQRHLRISQHQSAGGLQDQPVLRRQRCLPQSVAGFHGPDFPQWPQQQPAERRQRADQRLQRQRRHPGTVLRAERWRPVTGQRRGGDRRRARRLPRRASPSPRRHRTRRPRVRPGHLPPPPDRRRNLWPASVFFLPASYRAHCLFNAVNSPSALCNSSRSSSTFRSCAASSVRNSVDSTDGFCGEGSCVDAAVTDTGTCAGLR